MILVIDNYDSFTYNLVQYIGEIGEQINVVRNDEVTLKQIEEMNPDKIIISPGPKTPDEAGISLDVIDHFKKNKPILGVCLGHQAIAQAFGANVVRAEQIVHGKMAEVLHDGKTIFSNLENPLKATRYHSLIVEKETLPETLEISAQTEAGEIMAIRHRDYPLEGVQFHPESILTEQGKQLLKNFIQ
ncbi:anthranilate synthase component II [Longirhabdus pacifica]|uniref:anthranilate synthase component II n=1 Tax=Longirhabdus pacifica TaxID=2305227 RepID=UPI0010088EC5|nr:aminodeoxychorismate/anthranilate synthase component II [Longirhabdus pacifica]